MIDHQNKENSKDNKIENVSPADTVNEDNNNINTQQYNINFKKVVSQLALVGQEIANTYSEDNQDTKLGFIQALNELNQLEEIFLRIRIDDKEISAEEKDGLVHLVRYLREKIKKRDKAASGNSVNL